MPKGEGERGERKVRKESRKQKERRNSPPGRPQQLPRGLTSKGNQAPEDFASGLTSLAQAWRPARGDASVCSGHLGPGFCSRQACGLLHCSVAGVLKTFISQRCSLPVFPPSYWTAIAVVSLCNPWTVVHRLLCPRDFPGKHTGVGCHFFLQGIFCIGAVGKESEGDLLDPGIELAQCRRHKRCGVHPWDGKTSVEGHGSSLQYSWLENPMDRGAW